MSDLAAPALGLLATWLALTAAPATRSWPVVALAGLAGLAAALVVRRLVRPPALALLGAAVASVAAWLIPQRPDAGSAVVLTALFGVGAALAGRVRPAAGGRRAVPAILAAIVAVLIGLRATGERGPLLVVAGALVGAAALWSRRTLPPVRLTGGQAGFGTLLAVGTATLTAYFGASTVGASWFGGGIRHGPRSSGEVALTFDDGPNTLTTPAVMRILDDAGVQAAFFVVGKALVQDPAIVRSLYEHGQLVGDHSYHHDQWRWLDPRYPELARTQQAFARELGVCPAWFRPPHGQRTPFMARVVHNAGLRMVLWDVSVGDWALRDPGVIAGRVLAQVRSGSIIDLHDGLNGNPSADRTGLVRALPAILQGLQAKGLRPVRLDRLVGGRAYVPCPAGAGGAA